MFLIFVALIIFLEIGSAHLFDLNVCATATHIFKFELMLFAGAAVFSSGSLRDRSVLDIILIWATVIFFTDWTSYFPPWLSSYESFIFSALVTWVYFRPYKIIQGPVNLKNVCIAFYNGPNAPFLSRLASHVGLPFSSVALIVKGISIRPSKATGAMVETTAAVIRSKGYVIVDTGVKSTPEIYAEVKKIIGAKTGRGFFRTRCLKNLSPVLKLMGSQWEVKGLLIIPTLFYKRCVENVT